MGFPALRISSGFLQSDQFDCGYVCVATVAEAIGVQISPEQLKTKYGPPGRGLPIFAIKDMLVDAGISVQAVRLKADQLFDKLHHPAIVHHKIGHFVIVLSVSKRHVAIYDPAMGYRLMARDALQDLISDVVIEITDPRRASATPYRAQMPDWLCWKSLTPKLVALTGIAAAAMAISFIAPLLTSKLYNDGLQAGEIAIAAVLALALSMVFKALFDYVIANVTRKINRKASMEAVRSLTGFIARVRSSYLQNRTSAHYQKPIDSALSIVSMKTETLPHVMIGVPLMVAAIIAIGLTSPLAAVVVCAGGLLSYASGLVMRATLRSLEDSVSYQELHFRSMANNLMEALPSIHVLGCSKQAMGRYSEKYESVLHQRDQLANAEGKVTALRSLSDGIDATLFAAVCASLVAEQTITVGALVAFAMYKGLFSTGVGAIIEHRRMKLRAQAAQKHIDVLSHHLADEHVVAKQPFSSVTVRQLSYRINSFSENPILDGIAFDMKAGEWLVLSGKSGAGKTTLCKLLAGIQEPTAGSIVWNQSPGARIDVSFMIQDAKLIQGTIAENITLHDDSISRAAIEEACELAEIHQTIMAMPAGYNTLVGEGVGGLSGGQRQRILLARAVLRPSSLLILDEFSNNLDDETTAKILNNLRRQFPSIIFVSHNKHVIQAADRQIGWEEMQQIKAVA